MQKAKIENKKHIFIKAECLFMRREYIIIIKKVLMHRHI